MSNNSVGQASNQSVKTPFAETAFLFPSGLILERLPLTIKSIKILCIINQRNNMAEKIIMKYWASLKMRMKPLLKSLP